MVTPIPDVGQKYILEGQHITQLIEVLIQQNYQVIGPTVQDKAIIYDVITKAEHLPIGWTDEQDGATYRLHKRQDEALFGYVVGPHSWKKFLYPARTRLWQARRDDEGFHIIPEEDDVSQYAFFGVRACEIEAMLIQDKVFTGGPYSDPGYQARREKAFIVAVNCGQAGGTCFCTSMRTGPAVTRGFDLALTEILGDDPYFVVEVGTAAGAEILAQLPGRLATDEEQETAVQIVERAATQMGRTLDTNGLKELLAQSYEHPRWQNVAERCLACTNCTMVCPTCFCATVEDVTDLVGAHAERWRRWDSCFTMDFTYLHGHSVRSSHQARYRQWMTHKLSTWHDQFGSSGCVGCGRCITWCPAAIDITAEVKAIRETIS